MVSSPDSLSPIGHEKKHPHAPLISPLAKSTKSTKSMKNETNATADTNDNAPADDVVVESKEENNSLSRSHSRESVADDAPHMHDIHDRSSRTEIHEQSSSSSSLRPLKDRASDMLHRMQEMNFTKWISDLRQYPDVMKSVIQAYTALAIAREKRLSQYHSDLCQLEATRVNAATFLEGLKVKERAESVRLFIKEKYATHRHHVDNLQALISKKLELEKPENQYKLYLFGLWVFAYAQSKNIRRKMLFVTFVYFFMHKYETLRNYAKVCMQTPQFLLFMTFVQQQMQKHFQIKLEFLNTGNSINQDASSSKNTVAEEESEKTKEAKEVKREEESD